MALQLSITARNNRLDSFETTVGAAPLLTIRTGAPPANCAAANTGTVLASMSLPSDWLAVASGGSKAKSGTWQDLTADATGTAGHFRVHDTAGTTCHMQGTITPTGGGGDMTLDSVSITASQPVTVSTFTISDANA